ncbi:uncharacterized protein LOC130934037 [Arachis stenosperma]|uniref:uncharacterized protein LOC130934037 n=1 Tax=Arachis stenosperma TaxID=217475 RepID=UPI0025AD8FD7|nr:uncharacterized protein LOC130934037 [Arachis stenosperma]
MSAEIRSRSDIVLNIASSGIASLLLPNGRTAHSRFKIPLNIAEDSVCNIKPGSPQAMLLLKAKLIIWDEAPMVSRYCYEALDKCLGDIMRCSPTYSKDLPFGGKVVVLGRDFRQVLPVISRGSRQNIVHSTVNSSYLWKFCQVLKLIKNMRLFVRTIASDQDETEQFGKWLLKVGDGLIGDNMDGESEICLLRDIVIPSSDQAFDELVHFSYPNILENMSSKNILKARTILAPTLDIVEEVNNHLMAIIPGGKKLYLSSDSICMDEGNMESQLDLYGPELLNSINCSGLPPHKLILKVGVPVMLLRNIDQSSGLCNGTRIQVRKLRNHVIECEVLKSNNVGHVALIPRRICWEQKLNIPEKLASVIHDRIAYYQWTFIEQDPMEINESIVQEFYRNLLTGDTQTVFLIEQQLDTPTQAFKALLQLPHIPPSRDAYPKIKADVI